MQMNSVGDGKVQCPYCKKIYTPELGARRTNKNIQDEFPNAKPYQREQLVSGICSDRCWKEFLGPEL